MRPHGAARAFSLIELLAVLAVLTLVVGFSGALFVSARGTWRLARELGETNAAAQRVLQSIAADLRHTVGGPHFRLLLRQDRFTVRTFGAVNDELNLVTLHETAWTSNRTARTIQYFVEPDGPYAGRLVRVSEPAVPDDMSWPDARLPGDRHVLAEHVALLALSVPGGLPFDSELQEGRLPPRVDVLLELLTPADAAWAEAQPDPPAAVESRVRRHTVRIQLEQSPGEATP